MTLTPEQVYRRYLEIKSACKGINSAGLINATAGLLGISVRDTRLAVQALEEQGAG